MGEGLDECGAMALKDEHGYKKYFKAKGVHSTCRLMARQMEEARPSVKMISVF